MKISAFFNSFDSVKLLFWFLDRLDAFYAHVIRHKFFYLFLFSGLWAFSTKFEFAFNMSNSLDGTVFLIAKGELPSRNDYAVFYYSSDFIHPRNSRFLKRVAGVAGDKVESHDHHFFVNGRFVGKALPLTSDGRPIAENDFVGIIPTGYYYMQGDHPKSLDSRYKVVGLVPEYRLIGRAYKIF